MSRTVVQALEDIAGRIATRDPARSEATLQADIRAFILAAGLNLTGDELVDLSSSVDLESQVGKGSRDRIDIEAGNTVIEVKRDLTKGSVLADATAQLARYVTQRVNQTGARYLGVLTDGREWHLLVPNPAGADQLIPAGSPLLVTSASDTEQLRYWLGTVLATVDQLTPSPELIQRHLGADSPAHAADRMTLLALYDQGKKKPEVSIKKSLWGKLLRTAFGSGFEDSDTLFIEHTLLVITAEAIAHAVVGIPIGRGSGLSSQDLTSGKEFASAQIYGVVESDFFDWPNEIQGGAQFVASLADRLSRFNWSNVDHDVLKHLYESTISQATRASLGEYYTPDWLANRMIEDAIQDPLAERVLDPSCGSGTFIFHAIKAFLRAADKEGIPNGQALGTLPRHVIGMDVHPVAVTLARVTYLLAIGSERLAAPDREALVVPVYLGDSLQWEQRNDIFSKQDSISIGTSGDELLEGGGGVLFDDDLVFPRSIIGDAERFGRLVSDMADKALDLSNTQDRTLINPILRRFNVTVDTEKETLTQTFSTMRALHRSGRNHIWGYYVRNHIRPLWLAEEANRVDVLVGNPPWLRYNKMTSAMQDRYKLLAGERNLLSGALGASARDLSTLFVSRMVELYGHAAARFSFVMPWGTLTRKPHDGFRSGKWLSSKGGAGLVSVSFDESWDLSEISAATGFPMVSCVVRGQRSIGSQRVPGRVTAWHTKNRDPHSTWDKMAAGVSYSEKVLHPLGSDDVVIESPYKKVFRNGAILYPRVLLFVSEAPAGPLGPGVGRVRVNSRPSLHKPWNTIEPISGVVERDFVHPVHLGETVLPFRLLEPALATLPISTTHPSRLCEPDEIDEYTALSAWWEKVEEYWSEYRVASEKLPLSERIDYSRQLSSQLPLGQFAERVVYTKSGNSLTASRLSDSECVVENKLYWAPARSVAEGRYLAGILNSEILLERVRPLQSLGLFGARDFDKLIFRVPFAAFDADVDTHAELVSLVGDAELTAQAVKLSSPESFQKKRSRIRQALDASELRQKIEDLVQEILPEVVV